MNLKLHHRRLFYETDLDGNRIGKNATYIYNYVAYPLRVVTVRFCFDRLFEGLMRPQVVIELEDPKLFHFMLDYNACIPFDHFDPNKDIVVKTSATGRKIYLSEMIARMEDAHYAFFGNYGDEYL